MRCQHRLDSTNKTGIESGVERNYKSICKQIPHCVNLSQIKFQIGLRLKCLGVNRLLQL